MHLDKSSTDRLFRALRYATYDWTREMSGTTRRLVWTGILLQGFALYAAFSGSLIWPIIWPPKPFLYVLALLIYYAGYSLQNASLTSELLRKTRLAADEIAARQIQQTLQPATVAQPSGYRVETFYKPFRAVSGDYFDVIPLSANRILFAIADVSGKGMPAALLAANIQALVRSLSSVISDVAELAARLNSHLCRYTPDNRFATAFLAIIDDAASSLTYVNAGHNPPLVVSPGAVTFLNPTGIALGWFSDATCDVASVPFPPGSQLLAFTDGLTDSIADEDPDQRLRAAVSAVPNAPLSMVTSLINPAYNEDDITVLLVTRLELHQGLSVGA